MSELHDRQPTGGKGISPQQEKVREDPGDRQPADGGEKSQAVPPVNSPGSEGFSKPDPLPPK